MAAGPSLIVQLGVSGLGGVQAAFARVQGMAGSLATGLKSMALSAGALLGAGASVAGVATGLKEALDMGGRISDVAARTGIAAKSLTVLEQAFSDSGVAAESVGKSVAKMQDNLVSATRGDAGPARAFETLKLDARELLALEPDQQFAAIGKAIAGLDDPARRTAAAMDIFGKSGTELLALFRDATVFDVAAQRVSGLAEVMGRRAAIFDSLSDSLGSLKVKVMGLFAGMADSIVPELSRLADWINAIDLTSVGQKIGGFVSLVIQEWEARRFGDLIALTVEAGFEAGAMGARRVWDQLLAWLGSPNFWAQLAVGVIGFANATTKATVQATTAVIQPVVAWMTWVTDRWRFVFESVWEIFKQLGAAAINWLAEKLETVLSTAATIARTMPVPGLSGLVPAMKFGRIEAQRSEVTPPMTGTEAFAVAGEARRAVGARVGDFFDSGTAAAQALFGEDARTSASALEELYARINAIVAQRTSSEEKSSAAVKAALPAATSKIQLAEMERQAKDQLLALESRRALVEGNFGVTAAEKWRLKKASLEEERATLESIVTALREKAALETEPGAREQMLGRVDTYQSKLSGVNRGLGTMGPDPYSTPDQITGAITGLQDQFGTTAQAIARSFTSVIGSAVDSVAQGIEGLIMGTMTWADALRNVARTMLTTIVQAISRMFAEWIAKRALAAMKNMLFSAQEGAADTAAKAPGALLSSISSWGIAVAVGVAALVAAMAAFGGFKTGGYTGDGPTDQVAGVVHRGEFVIPAPTVQRIGLENLEAMRTGTVPASVPSTQAPQVSNDVRLAMFDSRVDARKWANSQDGETWFVDMARRTSHRWSRA